MKNGQNDITDELLAKYLLGEASGNETQQVQQWLNSSADNSKHYTDLQLLWDKSKGIATKSSVDTNKAWERFQKRTKNDTTSFMPNRRYNWLKIAALALLLFGAGTVLFLSRPDKQVAVKTNNIVAPLSKTTTSDSKTKIVKNETVKTENETGKPTEKKQAAWVETHRRKTNPNAFTPIAANQKKSIVGAPVNKTKGIICNNTPVPIEICITQTIKCNGKPSTVSTCSTLEPDESGRLHYKTHDKLGRHCTMSVDEITIRTISTGETIVLNAHSKPSTAQDFFKYITGQKKGGIVAGVFPDDCDASSLGNCGLKFDNNFGDLILQ